jgi:hypothetical protein
MAKDEVLAIAAEAREAGADRFCMGAAWRQAKDGPAFDSVLDMVRGVRALGMEACVTLGMLTEDQATRLKQAGLTAYNHNLDTSPEYTVRSSRSEHTTIGYARLPPCAAPGSRCVAAASSGWVKACGTGPACCRSWQASIRIPRACRSTAS